MIRDKLELPSLGGRGTKAIAIVFALLMVGMPLAAGAATISFDNGTTPTPYIAEQTLTKSEHEVGDDPLMYENNSGNEAMLPGSVVDEEDVANVYTYNPIKVNATDYSAFPHDKSDVSALEASEWTKDVSGSAGSATIAASTTAPGVDAVQFSTSGQTSSDTAKFTFSNFSVTSDESKRYGQLVVRVNSLDSGTTSTVQFVDSDGDYVQGRIGSSLTAGNKDVIANATGVAVWQHQFGDLTVQGSGDGTLNDIQKVVVTASDGNVDLEIAGLNAERMSEWQFGTHEYQADSDDEFETKTLTEFRGNAEVTAVGTLGPTFSDAAIHDLSFPVEYGAEALDSEDVKIETSEPTRPGYDHHATIYARLSVPDAYDLSHSGLALKDNQTLSTDRYRSVQVAEDTGDTDFADIEDSSWTDVTASYTAKNNTYTHDDTIQPGTNLVVKYELDLTAEDLQSMKEAPEDSGAGGAPPMEQGGGGFFSTIWGKIVAVVGSVTSALGLSKLAGWKAGSGA